MTLLGEMYMQEETRKKSLLKWFLLVILFIIIGVWCLDNYFIGFILGICLSIYVQGDQNSNTLP